MSKTEQKRQLNGMVQELNLITGLHHVIYKLGRSWWLKNLNKTGDSSTDMRLGNFDQAQSSLYRATHDAQLIKAA